MSTSVDLLRKYVRDIDWPSHLHRPAEQTFTVHQEVETYAEDDGDSVDIFTVGDCPPWNNRRPPEPSTTPTLQQMFTLARHMGYEMRPIARQTDAPGHLKEIDRSQIRIVDSSLRHGPVGTIPESSVSAVDSLDTCRLTVHDRTRPHRSNLWVGNSNLIIVNNGMAITNRETPHRPGPHPHWSTRASFAPHSSSGYITRPKSSPTGDATGRPISDLVTFSGRSTWGRGCYADFRSGPLVFGGMDW